MKHIIHIIATLSYFFATLVEKTRVSLFFATLSHKLATHSHLNATLSHNTATHSHYFATNLLLNN
jgi:hypothetical protein